MVKTKNWELFRSMLDVATGILWETFNNVLQIQDQAQKLSYCKVIFKRKLIQHGQIVNTLSKHHDSAVFACVLDDSTEKLDLELFLKMSLEWKTDERLKMIHSALRFSNDSKKLMKMTFEYARDCQRVISVFKSLQLQQSPMPLEGSTNFEVPFDAHFNWDEMMELLIPELGIKEAFHWANCAVGSRNYSLAAYILAYLNKHCEGIFVNETLCNVLRNMKHPGKKGKIRCEQQTKVHNMIRDCCHCTLESAATQPAQKRAKIDQ